MEMNLQISPWQGEIDPSDLVSIKLINSALMFSNIIKAVKGLVKSYERNKNLRIKREITKELENVSFLKLLLIRSF
jgi:hypothetical protein